MSLASVAALLAAQALSGAPPGPAPLIIDQGRPDRIQPTAPVAPPEADKLNEKGLAHVDAAGSGTPIRRIAFDGTKVPASVADAARPFIGQPATRELLDRLARALSDAYAKSDVALYTIAVPAQDLSRGVVHILVAEGFIEHIVYPKGSSPLLRAYGGRLAAEKPLTRRGLERYLSLMRDIPGAKIDATLLRGSKAGGVILSLVPTRKHSDFALGFDNQGTRQLGTAQMHAEAHGYGLLRDGDRTDLTLQAAPDFHRFRYLSLAHSTPLGSDGLSAGLSGGYLETRPKGSDVFGKAELLGVSLSYPLIRGYRRNLMLSLSLDGLNSDAAQFGALASSDRTRALRAAAGYSDVRTKRVVTAGATVSRGLDILGARSLAGINDTTFTKVNIRATVDQQIGKRLVARLGFSGQYSRNRLAAAEQFAVGGAEFGRAFDAAILTGDRGAASSGEIAFRPKLPARFEGSEIYGFADGARIRVNSRWIQPGARYDLASAGGGVRFAYARHASLNLEAARVIDKPYSGYSGDNWRFNVRWSLSLKR